MKIIIPINDSAYNAEMTQLAQAAAPPDVRVEVANITQGNSSIESRWDRMVNAPYVVELALAAEAEGCHGILVSDFDYCGVEAAREVVSVPVIGGFRPNVFTAMSLGQRFSIITVLASVVDMQREHVRSFGIEPNFASIIPVNLPVHELTQRDKVIQRVYECSIKAIDEDGADTIVLGCTGFNYIAGPVATKLRQRYGVNVPVMDPNVAAINYLYLLMHTGQSQSRLSYHVPPNFSVQH
ncbi:MAG: racemase [Pseudomonadales bacterium]|nr:racemase [Pseudomonadales bacterium]